jgi:HNH endonuclease
MSPMARMTVLPELNLPATSTALTLAVDAIETLLDQAAGVTVPVTAENLLDAVGWSYRRGKDLLAGLEGVLGLDQTQRRALADAFRQDRLYAESYDDAGFAFAYRALAPATIAAGTVLLRSMYEACVPRKLLEQKFMEANPTLRVCPYCLYAKLLPPSGSRSFLDADHFLPRSIYPQLSAHPENLVMVCKTCNGFKSGQDPLVETQVPLGLPAVSLPYKRAALHELRLEFPVAEPGQPTVRLTGATPAATVRVRTLNRLVALEHQWQGYIQTQHEVLMADLAREHGPVPRRAAVRDALREHGDRAHRAIPSDPIKLVDRELARWLATDALDTVLAEIRRRQAPPDTVRRAPVRRRGA